MKYSFFSIFSKPFYFMLTFFVAVFIFVGLGLFPNIPFIKEIILSPVISIVDVIKIIWGLVWSTGANLTIPGTIYTVVISFLVGVNISLAAFYARLRKNTFGTKAGTAGVLGFFFGFIGIGCASCGSILLVSFLPILGLSGLVAVLPLQGAEFSILSIILLSWSARIIFRGINTPMVCESKFDKK